MAQYETGPSIHRETEEAKDKHPDIKQLVLKSHLDTDRNGKQFLKFSIYLSLLQLVCVVYLPSLDKSTARVYVRFHLKSNQEE